MGFNARVDFNCVVYFLIRDENTILNMKKPPHNLFNIFYMWEPRCGRVPLIVKRLSDIISSPVPLLADVDKTYLPRSPSTLSLHKRSWGEENIIWITSDKTANSTIWKVAYLWIFAVYKCTHSTSSVLQLAHKAQHEFCCLSWLHIFSHDVPTLQGSLQEFLVHNN